MTRRPILAVLTIAAAVAFASTDAFAEEDICVPLGGIAESIMQMRQREAVMSDVLTQLFAATAPATHPVIRQLVIGAYSQPGYSTPKMQQNAIASFRNEVELACYRRSQGGSP